MSSPFAIAIANAPMLGSRSYEKLFAALSTAEDIWTANTNDLLASGLEPKRVDAFLAWRNEQSPHVWETHMTQNNIRLLRKEDPEHPPLLANIFDPPMYLFVQGASLSNRKCVAMVGSRQCSTYGKKTAFDLARDCARGGLSIVSGGAFGVDEASHQGALDAGGHTVCVLGSGLLGDTSNRQRMMNTRILENGGTLVSEFSLFAQPLKHHFPIRNRIVAGMCEATVLVEAAIASGSMITADAATRENREVCAVPGNISSLLSAGTNFLIKNGAHCITEAQDIFGLYGMNIPKDASVGTILPPGRSPAEIALFAVLSGEPMHIDDLAQKANLSAVSVAVAVTQLELLGLIHDAGGRRFYR